jgi:sigma-B regulation protein RsbU (phosphoserine phosphatase)
VRAEGRAPFASPEIKLAHAIAEQAGSQIENVLLHEETVAQARLETEMVLARSVQKRLLPNRAPSVPGLVLHGRTVPALQVGGDFYDFITTPAQGTRLCTFAVGDVSGKGLSAALVMAMTRTVLRSKANGGASPAQVLDGANAELYDDFTEVAMFATAFVGQYNPNTQALCFANAGHSPVIYCPSGGPARLLEADGTALGVLPVSLCEDYALPFGPGELLIMGTDGFSEATNAAGEMFGYERLLRLVESLADKPAEAILDALFAAIGSFAAGHLQEDDRTLVVAKGVAP